MMPKVNPYCPEIESKDHCWHLDGEALVQHGSFAPKKQKVDTRFRCCHCGQYSILDGTRISPPDPPSPLPHTPTPHPPVSQRGTT